MRKSAMGSSKYEFELEMFDKDVEEKRKLAEQFKGDLKEILYRDYNYREGKMSFKTKRGLLIEVHSEFISDNFKRPISG